MKGIGVTTVLGLVLASGGLLAILTVPMQSRLLEAAARVESLRAEADDLEARIEAMERVIQPGRDLARAMAHDAATAAAAGLDLQERAVTMARQSGLRPSTFGAHPPPTGLTIPAVGAMMEGEGELADLARFLAALEASRPPIAIERMTLRNLSRTQVPGGATQVGFRIALWGFWSEEGT